MPEKFRYAIWAAVSTNPQAAADKMSLPEQISRVREYANARGWEEAVEPYQMIGSRTLHVDLSAAAAANPVLARMLDDARAHKFNLLVMAHYDRLRDHVNNVAKVLEARGIQVFSVTQPSTLSSPENFKSIFNESGEITRAVMLMTQKMSQNQLRRDYATKMPLRVTEKGLPAIAIPYGYRKPPGKERDRNAVPVQDPDLIGNVVNMKDWFLDEGLSYKDIATRLNDRRIAPPRGKHWWPQTVKDILSNPFYAGYVRWGLTHTQRDPLTGETDYLKRAPDEYVQAQGKHTPLWDEATMERLNAAMDVRRHNYIGRSANQFTSLLECAVCNARLWMQKNGGVYDHVYHIATPDKRIWRCRDNRHPACSHEAMIELVGVALTNALRNPKLLTPPQMHTIPQDLESLDNLKERMKRLEDAYLRGVFSIEQYQEHSASLTDQIKTLETRAQSREQVIEARRRFVANIGGLVAMRDNVVEWLRTEDPPKVNAALKELIDGIVYDDERGRVVIKWKEV